MSDARYTRAFGPELSAEENTEGDGVSRSLGPIGCTPAALPAGGEEKGITGFSGSMSGDRLS